jgi:hypothetical protein
MFFVLFFVPMIFVSGKKSKPPVAPPSKISLEKEKESTTSAENMPPSLLEAKKKEKEILTMKGKYFEGIPQVDVQEPVPVPNVPPELKEAPPEPVMKETEPEYVKMARQIRDSILNRKVQLGELYAFTEKENEKKQVNSSMSKTKNEMPPVLIPGQFYKAVILNTMTSANPKALVIAELLEGLKGARLLGRIASVFEDDNKIDVLFERMVYKDKVYKVQASAFSMDKTQGVATKLQYNVLAKIFTTGVLAGAQSALDALREDETTEITTLWGSEVVQEKSENRFREGVLAGASSAFGEAKNAVSSYMNRKQDVKVILEKGTPIYVVFW